ncbi:3-deoxy-manno-octulosonate cytidylyltransferase [Aurantiacibacter gangjinensis]|uniref:3-deoxy-manno-octulosonate cytidylyltransferase n=1 Tax=Aurantiacibacter gangjinensis TaxID=502682 RepID=A0A0G9MRA7_9SPHN|nr:3-deoxy-manno-octulosonate cytidylyltransferase [Aurantiacibacter gangjinensis]APE27884.1 3-deoxy-manno-octulosonate cytidylyltransferase [Aurantiacibacter gangjinensis]KLE31848.1 3-deoxy-manno-octulosonate cytidylyltransferase [Aurantiacibacter gangjinensis]
MADVMIVIPARFASQRYPGKPLAPLRGKDGEAKSLIHRSWEAAMRVEGVSRVAVATDSQEIVDAVEGFGGEAIWTLPECRNGTERCAEVLGKLDAEPDLIVNLQGDAPLTPAYFVESLIERMAADESAAVATPVVRVSASLYETLAADERKGIVGGTFAATSGKGHAHYFSKRMIPHFARDEVDDDKLPLLLHIGLYAYRPAALRAYVEHSPTALEQLEGLEQLRFLDMGAPITVVEVAPPEWDIWELNNPSDVEHVENSLRIMGVS